MASCSSKAWQRRRRQRRLRSRVCRLIVLEPHLAARRRVFALFSLHVAFSRAALQQRRRFDAAFCFVDDFWTRARPRAPQRCAAAEANCDRQVAMRDKNKPKKSIILKFASRATASFASALLRCSWRTADGKRRAASADEHLDLDRAGEEAACASRVENIGDTQLALGRRRSRCLEYRCSSSLSSPSRQGRRPPLAAAAVAAAAAAAARPALVAAQSRSSSSCRRRRPKSCRVAVNVAVSRELQLAARSPHDRRHAISGKPCCCCCCEFRGLRAAAVGRRFARRRFASAAFKSSSARSIATSCFCDAAARARCRTIEAYARARGGDKNISGCEAAA